MSFSLEDREPQSRNVCGTQLCAETKLKRPVQMKLCYRCGIGTYHYRLAHDKNEAGELIYRCRSLKCLSEAQAELRLPHNESKAMGDRARELQRKLLHVDGVFVPIRLLFSEGATYPRDQHCKNADALGFCTLLEPPKQCPYKIDEKHTCSEFRPTVKYKERVNKKRVEAGLQPITWEDSDLDNSRDTGTRDIDATTNNEKDDIARN